jgi:hypothetical protein
LVVCGGDDRVKGLNKKVGHGEEFKVLLYHVYTVILLVFFSRDIETLDAG